MRTPDPNAVDYENGEGEVSCRQDWGLREALATVVFHLVARHPSILLTSCPACLGPLAPCVGLLA